MVGECRQDSVWYSHKHQMNSEWRGYSFQAWSRREVTNSSSSRPCFPKHRERRHMQTGVDASKPNKGTSFFESWLLWKPMPPASRECVSLQAALLQGTEWMRGAEKGRFGGTESTGALALMRPGELKGWWLHSRAKRHAVQTQRKQWLDQSNLSLSPPAPKFQSSLVF